MGMDRNAAAGEEQDARGGEPHDGAGHDRIIREDGAAEEREVRPEQLLRADQQGRHEARRPLRRRDHAAPTQTGSMMPALLRKGSGGQTR